MHITTCFRKFRYILFCFIFLSTLSSFGQSGPGGVFSDLWLRADSAVFSDAGTTPAVDTDPVVQWNDVSGVGNNASVGGANPTFQIGGQNGRPYLSFSDDDMDFALDAFASDSADRSVFVVAEYPSTPGSQQYFFSYGPNVTSQRYSLGVSPSDNLIVEMQGDGITSDNTVAAASPFIFSTIYPFGGGALNTSQIFINGTNSTHTGGAATPATVLTSGSVGALADNAGLQFNGDIYEVIYYGFELNAVERTIVENYLSAKYDIPISNDLYAGDLIPSGDFDFDVIGIGRDAGANHIESASGGLKLADDSFLLDDGDYVFAGHSGTPNGFATTDLPANHNMRLARDWYIDIADATSNGGTINLEFDLAEMGLSVPTDAFSVVLITRPGTSGAYTEVMMDTGISGDIVEFYGVDVTTLVDGHKYTVAFATENGLDFDGAGDYVELFEDDLFTGDFTVEAWVYLDDFIGDYRPIISKSNSVNSNAEFNLQVQQSTGNVNFFLGNGSGISQVSGNNATDQDITLNTWTHIAAVVQGTDLFLYINGQLSGSSTFSGIRQNNANPVQIGRYFNGATQFWDGQIDEVRIWNTARTQEQINANAFNTIISQGTLEASYDFNQGVPGGNNGTITSLPDLTPNLNNGTLQGPFALSGNTSNWVSSTAWNADIFPPIFLSGYPLIDNITTTGFDITVQLNEPGTYFYVVVPDGATPPSVDDVRGGTGFGGTGEVAAGNIAVTTPATDFVLSPTGLIPNTFYDLYIVAQDDEGSPNVQNTNTFFDVTTEAGFVTRWVTSDGQITIPTTGGGYNYSVEWNNITNAGINEGFIDGRTGDYTITGMENGSTYEVIIRGAFPRIYFNNTGDKDKIQSIEQWGNISWTFFQSAFYGCTNLTYNATDAPDLTGVSGLGSMFRNASSFNATDLTSWDVSGINDMGLMFSGATAFAGDVSSWDVSNVVTMTELFRDLPSFNSDISGWVTTSASNMLGMFQGSSSFNRDLSGWDLNGVGNTSFMFFNASSFDQDLSLWDVTTISNMTNMLSNTATSVANYDAILNGWASQSASLQVGVTLGVTGLGYSSAGAPGRDTLTTAPSSWTISGDQLVTPAAPTNLIAYASSATDITLEWSDNATNETNYQVERADDYAFATNVITITSAIAANATSHVFNAGTDQPYYYRVTPLNGFEDASSQSSIEFATTEAFAGHALSFDGTDDSVVVQHDPQLNLVSGDFAIESWVYLNASGIQTIASKGDGNGIATDDVWIFQIQGDKIALQLVDGVSTSEWGLSTTNVPLNEWVHVAVSFTGTTASFYLNGVADGTHNYGFSPSDNGDSQSMYMARQGSVCDCNHLNGDLDEFKIWSAVKSDFSDRYSLVDLSIPQPNLVAYYSFDEGVGATNTVDASANINDGSIGGATSIPSTVVQDGVVSNTNDSGPGSLREAINYANANSPTTITFNIPGGGPYTIGVTTTLPDITAAGTIIDGTSQPGWTFGDVNNMVSIDGSGIGSNSSGININEAPDVEIYGLIITGFSGLESHAAIELTGDGSDNVMIGAPGMGNIIYGGGTSGIYITHSDSTIIRGNWIGTLNGTTPSGNNHHGISAAGAVDDLTIGGNSLSGEGNIISGAGNGRYGITTNITGTNLSIKGNLIGTDSTGNAPMNNEAGGIDVGGAVTFVVGGVGPGERNIISGNNTDTNADGINVGNGSSGSILNNYIGVGADGTTPLGNGGYGILFANSASNVLVDGNTISDNGTDGLYLGNGSSTLTVSNNIIGLTPDGLDTLGNTNDGIRITNGTNITISGNTISANGSNGIAINGDQTNLDINTNVIGLDVNGQGDMVLLGDGVTVSSDNTFGNLANGIVLNLVDGASSGNSITGNLISGNGVFADENTGAVGIGIYINADTRGFTIQDNVIGLEGDEVTPQKNINSGIYISGLSNSVIGGTGANEANLIGHNGDYGIEKLGTNMNGVDVHANEFDCNEKGGISFTSVPDIDAPIIDLVSPSSISGSTTAEDNSNIFIYEADSCASDQGLVLVTEAIDAVSGGVWSVAGSFDPTKSYVSLVVDDTTTVNATLSTSEFSAPAMVPASVVSNVNDTGTGSLREAINFANANPGTTITFDIAGGGPWVINLSTALPQITANNIIIDGFTQPGWVFGDPNAMVQINGSGIGGNANGINIAAANAEVYGLIFTGFLGNSTNGNVYLASDAADNAFIGSATKGNIFHSSGGNAIYIVDGDSAVIQGNRIGTLDGSTASAMGDHGISTTGEITDLIIGGDFFTGDGNLISAAPSNRYGLNLFGSGGGSGLTNVKITGNKIGTNDAADGAIPNTLGGINILGTIAAVEIGGPSPSDLNIISGNGDHGIIIQAGNTFDIDGNYIGLQSDGSTALGNAGSGIRINPAAVNVNVGTNSQNIISENTGSGILFDGNTSSNTALGTNIFSCNASGGIGYGSGPLTPGATIDDVNFNTAFVTTGAADGSSVYIYYADDGCSNDQGIAFAGSGVVASGEAVISGGFAPNSHYVALVEDVNGFSTFSSPFFANFVMVTNTNDTGTGSLRAAIDSANTYPGASIYFNIPGGAPWEINLASDLPTITAQGTIIDATTQLGWNIATGDIPQISGGGSASIGLNASNNFFEVYGLHIRDFTVSGIRFNTTGTAANGYQIGGPFYGNIITNCGTSGINIISYTGGGSIQGNFIGLMPNGTTIGSNTNGISLGTNADNVLIGGPGSGEGNVISNSATSEITLSSADSVIIRNNIIGLTPDESTAAAGGANGINLNGADGSTIEENVIAAHTSGIRLNNASGHTIRRNFIGVSSDGTTPFPNTNGIHMINNLNSDNNIIGSNTNTGDGNTIAENTGNAILIEGSGNNGNQIQRNSIFNNAAGITLGSGAHNGILPPGIDPIAVGSTVTGTGTDGDEIDLYYDDSNGQGNVYLGSATVSGGTWSIGSLGLTNGDQVVATATNATDGTSEFSAAASYTFNYPVAEGAGEALSFDGTDDLVVITNDPSFENPTYTLETWVSITSNPGNGDTDAFINMGTLDGSLDGNGYTMGYTYDGANYQVFLGHVNGSNTVQPLMVNYTLNLGEWYHVAGVYDGTDMILYVNGEEIGRTTADAPDYIGDATDIRLGGYHSVGGVSAGDFLNAQLDEIQIWDFAKNEGEIRVGLAQKITGNPSGLVGYYRMDDSGDTGNLLDYQGVHNGVISGGATYGLSGAHLGDYSTFEYSYTAGSGRNLDVFRVENLGTANLPLHIYRVSGTPANNVVSGFDNIADTAYYGVFSPGQTYDVVDSIGSLTADRRMLYRADGADTTWTSISGVLGIRLEDDQIYAYGQSGSGQFVTAIDQNPYPTPVDAGYSMNFNGTSNYVTLPDFDLSSRDQLTLEAWVNPSALSLSTIIRQERNGLFADWFLSFDASNIYMHVRASGVVTHTVAYALPVGEWSHVAGVYNGSQITVYVNGVEIGTPSAASGTLAYNPTPIHSIGAYSNDGGSSFNEYLSGQIDEVRVWDIALGQTNIRDHMIQKIDADFDSLSHLVAYYRFDENSSATAANLAGDSDGTITGATPVISGAPQGQGSLYSYDGTPGVLNTAQFGEDINVYYDDATGGIHGYVVQGNPNQLQAAGFNNLDQGKYYGVFAPSGQKVEIRMDYNGGVDANRRIVYRKDASDTAAVGGWERLSGLLNTSDAADSVFAFNVGTGEVSTAVLNPPSSYPIFGDTDAGDALSYDGTDDYVEVAHAENISVATAITIEAWVRRTRLDDVDVILEKGGDWTNGETNYGIGLNNNANGNMFFFTWNGGGRGTNGVTDFDWHHYAAVASEGDTDPKLYIDGVLQTIDNTFGNATIVLDETTTKNLHIGAQVDPGFDFFSANEIDEIRIWNDTLSEGSIVAYANTTDISTHPNYADMLAYYKFDDGTGSTILEDVFSNNDGTLTNMDENTDWVPGPTLDPGIPLGEDFDSDLPTTTDQALDLGSGLWEGLGVKSAEDSTKANGGVGDAALMLAGAGNYLTTPTLDGVNQFTFYYRADNAGGSGFVFDVFTSSDGGITFDQEIASDSSNNTTTYKEFNYNFGSAYTGPIRIVYDAAGSENGLIDDFFADVPAIRPEVTVTTLLEGDTTVNIGDQDILIYKVQVDVANSAAAAEGLYLTILGADSTDFELDGFKFYENVGLDDFGSATLIDSSSWSPGAPVPNGSIGKLFSNFHLIGTPIYYYVTADISPSANPGTFSVSIPDIDQFGFGDSDKLDGGLSAGDNITIQAGTTPLAPTDFVAIEEVDGSVTLSWTDNASDETDYIVEQSTDNAAWSPFGGSLGVDAVTFNTGPLGLDTAYWWRAVAVGTGGNATSASRYAGNITPPGHALDFDGIDDHVTVGDIHDFASPFTIEAWVSRASTGAADWVVSNGTTPVNASEYLHFGFAAGDQVTIDFFGDGVSSVETVTDNDWHHIAAVYDGSNIGLYLDGDSLTIADPTIAPFAGVGDFRIGQAFDTQFFEGQLDEVRVWSRDLTHGEIQANLYNTLSGTEPNLMGYYRFDHSAEFELADYSDGNTSGFLQGMDSSDWVPSGAFSQVIPDATFTTIPVAGGPLTQGSVDNLVYQFTIEATGGDVTKESMIVAVGGDATTADFSASGWKLYESINSDTGIGGASLVGSTNIGDAAPDSVGFAMSGDILDGDIHYFYIAVDIDAGATVGNSFNVVLWNGDPAESVGIGDPKNKIDGGFVDSDTFTVQSSDSTSPTPLISSSESSPTNANPIPIAVDFGEVVVGFDSTDLVVGNGTAQNFVDVDGQNFTFDIVPTADGAVTVDIADSIAQDLAGNENLVATQFSIDYDGTGPSITLDQDGLTINDTNLTGTISDPTDAIQFSVDGGTTLTGAINNGDGTWSYDLSSDPNFIGDGLYNIYLDVSDTLGNQTISSAETVTIDLTGPVIVFDQDGQTTNDINLSGTTSDASDVVQLSLDGGTTLTGVTVNGDATWTYDLSSDPNYVADGAYSIYVDASDALGNQTISSSGTVTIDQTAPVVEVDIYGTSITSPQITGIIDDLGATIEVTVNGETNPATNVGDGTWSLAAGILTDLADGTYDVQVSATDLAGNVGTDQTSDELVISQDIFALVATQITPTSFRANWSEGLDVQSYELDVSTVSDFSTFLPGFESLSVPNTSRFAIVTGLDFSTNYYYRVRLVNTASQVSANSNTRVAKTTVGLATLADSLALVQIHDAIQPQGLNWGSARLRDWDGVTLGSDRTRVEIVNISSTQSIGDMPNPFVGDAFTNGGLSNLTGMDVSDNQITGLMDFSSTSISTLFVNDNNLQFDDLEPVVGITTLDYANQASVQYNETTDGSPIEVRYTSDYLLSIGVNGTGIGGSANTYSWFRNEAAISSNTDFAITDAEGVILDIDYDNMGVFRTEVTSSLVPGLVIDVDSQTVWAIADMEVSVADVDGNPLSAPFNAYMLETTRIATGFRVLETLENQTSSTFTFPDVVLGDYITFVESDLELYIPTYFGNVFEWTEADTLFFRSDDVISMIMTEVPRELTAADGNGSLDVLIEEDFEEEGGRIDARRRAAKRKCGLRRKRSGGRIGQDDDDFELIAYGETDDNGEFQFGFLPQGTYRFFVEYPGIPLDESSFVEFEVGEEGVSDTDFKLQAFATEEGIEVQIEAVLGVILEYFKDLRIYPNPSSEYLNIGYRHLKSRDVTAELMDLSGNRKWSTDLRNGFDGELRIDVTDFEAGIYILRFYDRESPRDNVVSFRVIVK